MLVLLLAVLGIQVLYNAGMAALGPSLPSLDLDCDASQLGIASQLDIVACGTPPVTL